jgi:glutamate racemase
LFDVKLIIVTDSGIGGISTFAYLNKKFPTLDIVFFNALSGFDKRYQDLKTMKQKAAVFNKALEGMMRFNPDHIIIACNTLSIVYPYTKFSKKKFPVLGIVDAAVDAVKKCDEVIIFGTKTTIQQGTYRGKINKKYPKINVIQQSCPGLAKEIGKGNVGSAKKIIRKCVSQALKKSSSTKITASLNCTHFGYLEEYFKDEFSRNGRKVKIINPNFIMAKDLKYNLSKNSGKVQVVSKVKIPLKAIKAIRPYIEKISSKAYIALKNYKYDPDLF